MIHPILNIAIRAARRAGEIIARAMDRIDRVHISAKTEQDFVTNIDIAAEKAILETIEMAYPRHGILAEESGKKKGQEFTWIIDPLDGTSNFIHRFPHFAVSIAVQSQGSKQVEHGVVYDPVREELFTATRGTGAQLNGHRIRVSPQKNLNQALLATGLPFSQRHRLDAYFEALKNIFQSISDIRRSGSAAMDLAYVAAGRLDGYWEVGLKPWDIAAGALLVQEAGGLVSDLKGNATHLESGEILAANLHLFKALLPKVSPLGGGAAG